MCLAYREDFPINTNVGFKVFQKNRNNGQLFTNFIRHNTQKREWLKDDDKIIYNTDGYDFSYRGGYHIYKSYKCAKRLQQYSYPNRSSIEPCEPVVYKVLFKDVVAKGVEYEIFSMELAQVIVAKEMFIVDEIN